MRKAVKMLVAAFVLILMNETSVCAAQDYTDSDLQNFHIFTKDSGKTSR